MDGAYGSTYTPDPGADSLDNIMSGFPNLNQIGPAIQKFTNQVAMLQAQNDDIANGRWTLNNLVAQWNTMTPNGQLAAAAIAIAVAYVLLKKG
jgi:hypothetical protein